MTNISKLQDILRTVKGCDLLYSLIVQITLGIMGSMAESKRTLYPYVTRSSIVAIKYKDRILMATDMGGSYGSTLQYKSIEHLKSIVKHTLLGASGEISDFQEILRYLNELMFDCYSLYDNMWNDGNFLDPKEMHNHLTHVMYNRRNKFNPLWNLRILGGVKNGQKNLGIVNMTGIIFEDNHVAIGLGNHLARPILRDEWNENLTFEEGIAKITKGGFIVFPPFSLKTYWDFSAFKKPMADAPSSWQLCCQVILHYLNR